MLSNFAQKARCESGCKRQSDARSHPDPQGVVRQFSSTPEIMAEITLLPFSAHRRFGAIFDHAASPEGSLAWFQSLAESTLDPGEDAVVAVAFDDAVAKAALPLVRNGAQMRALTAPYTTLYAPGLGDAKWARFLGAGAQQYVRGSLRLDALDPADPGTAAYLEGVKSSGLMAAQYCHFVNYYEGITNFEEYWNARPTRLKATVRRKLSNARVQHVDFCCHRNAFSEAVANYDEIYRASWKAAEPHPRFIANMVEKLGPDGLVRLGIMTLSGKPVAAQIWLVRRRKGTIFKLAHRQDAVEYSPGTLLTHWMISTLVRDEALDEIDFGRGADDYKRDWLKECRVRTGLVASSWKTAEGLRNIASGVLPTQMSAMLRRGLDHVRRIYGFSRSK